MLRQYPASVHVGKQDGCLPPWTQNEKSGVSAQFALLLTRKQHHAREGLSWSAAARLESFGRRVLSAHAQTYPKPVL